MIYIFEIPFSPVPFNTRGADMLQKLIQILLGTSKKKSKPPRKVYSATSPTSNQPEVGSETSFSIDSSSPLNQTRLEQKRKRDTEEAVRRDELREQLNAAKHFDECIDIHNDAADLNNDEGVGAQALEKALALASTAEEFQIVYDSAGDSDLEKKAAEKQEQVFLERIDRATTTSECIDIENEADNDFNLWIDADAVVKKALSLATSESDCRIILEDRDFDDPEDNTLLREIYEKMVSFFTSVDECEELWSVEGTDSLPGTLAIVRAAEIIRSQYITDHLAHE